MINQVGREAYFTSQLVTGATGLLEIVAGKMAIVAAQTATVRRTPGLPAPGPNPTEAAAVAGSPGYDVSRGLMDNVLETLRSSADRLPVDEAQPTVEALAAATGDLGVPAGSVTAEDALRQAENTQRTIDALRSRVRHWVQDHE